MRDGGFVHHQKEGKMYVYRYKDNAPAAFTAYVANLK